MWKCEKCKEYRYDTVKQCNCKSFTVVDEDGESQEIQAMDREGAALKFAEKTNTENEYWLMNETTDIFVDDKAFRVGAEPDVHYSVDAL